MGLRFSTKHPKFFPEKLGTVPHQKTQALACKLYLHVGIVYTFYMPRTPRIVDPLKDIPQDIVELCNAIAKRFRKPGARYPQVMNYLSLRIYQEAVTANDGNIAATARALGVARPTIYDAMAKYERQFKKNMKGRD